MPLSIRARWSSNQAPEMGKKADFSDFECDFVDGAGQLV